MTLYQLYKFAKRMMNSKGGDYGGFQNSNIADGSPLMSSSDKRLPNASFGANSDEYMEAQRLTSQAQDTFNFDTSEIGSLAVYGDFDEYSGPSINQFSADNSAS